MDLETCPIPLAEGTRQRFEHNAEGVSVIGLLASSLMRTTTLLTGVQKQEPRPKRSAYHCRASLRGSIKDFACCSSRSRILCEVRLKGNAERFRSALFLFVGAKQEKSVFSRHEESAHQAESSIAFKILLDRILQDFVSLSIANTKIVSCALL